MEWKKLKGEYYSNTSEGVRIQNLRGIDNNTPWYVSDMSCNYYNSFTTLKDAKAYAEKEIVTTPCDIDIVLAKVIEKCLSESCLFKTVDSLQDATPFNYIAKYMPDAPISIVRTAIHSLKGKLQKN